MKNVKDEIYRRIITLLTLRTNMDTELFKGTLRTAVSMVLVQYKMDPAAAIDLSETLAPLIQAELMLEREVLRSVARGHTGCGKPNCAGCRISKWASETPPTGASDPDLERRIAEALGRISKDGPVN